MNPSSEDTSIAAGKCFLDILGVFAMAALVSRSGGPGILAGVWVAFLALVVLAHQLEQWRKETEERKRDARRKFIVGAAALDFRAALRVVLRAAVTRDIDKAAIPDLLAFVFSIDQLEQWGKETEERKRDARRKIIVGDAAFAHAEVDPGFRAALRVALRATVTRDIDKAAIPDLLRE